ncbi:ABC transporter ATP-binding protein [Fusibacter sp. JL216-2]|uniref:ABC transporter ATP-binding protein n=1 Tax=Fusibacter sp. JL216-2 TaxID=3071453 RepID=UPI003D32B894
MKTISRFLKISKKYWLFQVIGFILTVLYALAYFASPIISKYMIDEVLPSESYNKLASGIALFLLVCIMQPIVGYLKNVLFISLSEKISNSLRLELFDSLLKTKYNKLYQLEKGMIISRVLHDTENIGSFITTFFVSALKNFLIIILIIGAMFYLSPMLTTLVLVISMLSALIVMRLSFKTREFASRTFDSRDNISILTGQVIENIEVIKSFLMETKFVDFFKERSTKYMDVSCDLGKSRQKHIVSVESIVVVCTMLIYGYGFFGVMRGFMSLGTVVALGLYFQMLVPAIVELTNSNVQLQQAVPSLDRIEEILGLPKEYSGKNALKRLESITIDKVHFSYVENAKVFDNFSLGVKRGEILGIKGENGSGKSTLVKMIMGLLNADNGQIFFNESEIASYKIESIRSQITYAPQNAKLNSDTVMSNIKSYDDSITDEKVFSVSRDIGYFDDINALHNGFETVVSEGGNLSGGQMRKISLLRAFVRNSDVYILDEPFTGLDSESCELLIKYLNKIKKDKIILIISHNTMSEFICDRTITLKSDEFMECVSEPKRMIN